MEKNEIEKPNHKSMWKSSRIGVIIFCVIHFFFEIATGNSQSAAIPVFVNYLISAWYIKRQIAKGKEINSLLLAGLSVAGVVFLIRLALGAVFILIITN